jgi:hydroxymethylglutaryl-CoA lyase
MAKDFVHVFEVGPRDGIQNEKRAVKREHKVEFVNSLFRAGIRDLELGAFVRPDRVPQMADTDWLYTQIRRGKIRLGKSNTWALVPNRVGLERAIAAGVKNIAVFTAATESFARKNIGMSIDESLETFAEVIAEAKRQIPGVRIRGYVSTAFGCPFEGKVPARQAIRVVERLAKLGASQISIGDTIGVATPNAVRDVIQPVLKLLGTARVAGHFHDTRGTALANALRALDLGVRTLDSSAGGLGGCPFAPSATGNLATEDLVYMLDGMGISTGINLDLLCQASLKLAQRMKRPLSSRYLQAYVGQCD